MRYVADTVLAALKTAMIFLAFILVLLLFMSIILSAGKPKGELRLNEVLLNPAKAGWDDGFIEIVNMGRTPADMGGWTLASGSGSRRLSGTVLPGGYMTIYGQAARSEGDVSLYDGQGRLVDSYRYQPGEGASQARSPDGFGAFTPTNKPTPGEPNAISSETAIGVPYMPECMAAEYEAAAKALADQGYAGDSSGFCSDFRQRMFEEDPQVRRRIAEIGDADFRSAVAESVAERAVAAKREERAAYMNVSEGELVEAVAGLVRVEPSVMGFDGEMREMSLKFRNMLFDVAVNGSVGEKGDMAFQIGFYLKSRDYKQKKLILDAADIRARMGQKNMTLCGTGEYRIC